MKEHFLVNLKSSLKETAGLVRWKWTELLLFEVVYKVILLILVQPGLDNLKVDGIITDNVYLTFFVLETRGISLSVINMADQILGGDAEKQLFQ